MGILDSIVKAYTPVGKVTEILDNAGKAPAPQSVEVKTPQQAAYEAKTAAMNAKNNAPEPVNPVPRAKGGPVKAGGCPMKNVDNSGMTKMKAGK